MKLSNDDMQLVYEENNESLFLALSEMFEMHKKICLQMDLEQLIALCSIEYKRKFNFILFV